MLTVVLPDALETAVAAAAHRTGLSIDDYLTAVCADALSLEIDRTRVDSFLAGTSAISHDRARSWLTDLAEGNRTECPC
jgi:hypothetical protein